MLDYRDKKLDEERRGDGGQARAGNGALLVEGLISDGLFLHTP